MKRCRLTWLMVMLLGILALVSPIAIAADSKQNEPPPDPKWNLVRGHCSPCHSMRLVTQQRLDRLNWEWVMEDMVKKYGATWISKALQKEIIDYLVEHYGPDK